MSIDSNQGQTRHQERSRQPSEGMRGEGVKISAKQGNKPKDTIQLYHISKQSAKNRHGARIGTTAIRQTGQGEAVAVARGWGWTVWGNGGLVGRGRWDCHNTSTIRQYSTNLVEYKPNKLYRISRV